MQKHNTISLFGWKSFSLGQKFVSLQISLAVVLSVIFLPIFHFIMSNFTNAQLDRRIVQNNMIVNNFLVEKIAYDTSNLSNILKANLSIHFGDIKPQSFEIQGQTTLQDSTAMFVPNLTLNGVQMANNFPAIDEFATLTSAEATIFVKENNGDFVRISTSLRNAKGERLIGTKIDATHPAHQKVLNNQSFYGRVELFGKDYVSVYEPIANGNEVIGILFVAYKLDSVYGLIRSSMEGIRVGENGSIVVLDKKYDKFILGYDGKANDFNFYSNLKDFGIVEFNYGGNIYRSYYDYNQPLGIYVITQALKKDFTKASSGLEKISIAAILVLLLSMVILTLVLTRGIIIKRLNNTSKTIFEFLEFINHKRKEAPKHKEIVGNDEIAKLHRAINEAIIKIQKDIKQDSLAITQSAQTAKAVESGDLSAR
ncbi:Cache 3/Cache 2 fusion domain-containing protein, partial [Helicobacter turcicus]